MRKLFKRGSVAALVFALVAILAAGTALAESVYAYAETFIRSTPGNTGSVLDSMSAGTSGAYLGESWSDPNGTTWYYVSYGRGSGSMVKGWVSGTYAELRMDPVAPKATIPPSILNGWPYVDIIDYPYAERVVARNGRSFIRNGPSTDAKDLGSIPKDGIAAYLGWCCTDMNGREWYYISYNGIVGWVSARHTVIE